MSHGQKEGMYLAESGKSERMVTSHPVAFTQQNTISRLGLPHGSSNNETTEESQKQCRTVTNP